MLEEAKKLLEIVEEEYTKAVIDCNYNLDDFAKLAGMRRALLTYIFDLTEEDF